MSNFYNEWDDDGFPSKMTRDLNIPIYLQNEEKLKGRIFMNYLTTRNTPDCPTPGDVGIPAVSGSHHFLAATSSGSFIAAHEKRESIDLLVKQYLRSYPGDTVIIYETLETIATSLALETKSLKGA